MGPETIGSGGGGNLIKGDQDLIHMKLLITTSQHNNQWSFKLLAYI